MAQAGIQFKPDTPDNWRGPGAPPVRIPEELQVWLERSYQDNCLVELPIDSEDDDDVRQLLYLADLYCRRQSKKLRHQFAETDTGRLVLRLKMRDPRTYTRPTAPRERR